jgi:hypothetical protein
LIDFKNTLERDSEMRIGYDTVSIDRLTISSLNANNQWNWDQFVFTKEGNFGVGVAIPKEKIVSSGKHTRSKSWGIE